MSNEQRITILKQEIYDLLQTYKVAIKKYMNEKDPLIKKLLHDGIIKICKMDKEKRKILSDLENSIRRKKEEDKGIRYCYVRLYNPFVDYERLKNIIIGDSLYHTTIPEIRLKPISKRTIGSKTKYIDDPFPILCKSVDNEKLFDLITGDEYILIDKYDCDYKIVKYKGNSISINPKALTNIPAFTISQYMSENTALDFIQSLDETQKEKYESRMNRLKEIINESYNDYSYDLLNKKHKVKLVKMKKIMR